MFLVLLTVLIGLLTYFWRCGTSKPAKFPPGPPRYPVVGSAFLMKPPNSSEPEIFWGVRQFAIKYGSIIGFYLGNTRVVVFTDLDDIRDIFNREETSFRPPVAGTRIRPGWHTSKDFEPELNHTNPPGVAFSNVSDHVFLVSCLMFMSLVSLLS